MNSTGNTILITGGGSGIGRGLAEALQALGNQVIIAGRRKQALEETAAANPGMKSIPLDIESPAAIRAFAAKIAAEFPSLNVLINNAGIMRAEKLFAQQSDLADAEATVATNLLGPIRLIAVLLPHLLKQPRATIINVSSGLAFVPLAITPTYCATKAAIHSYTQSLRYQLKNTPIEVLELRRRSTCDAAGRISGRIRGHPDQPAHTPGDLRGTREPPAHSLRKRTLREDFPHAQCSPVRRIAVLKLEFLEHFTC